MSDRMTCGKCECILEYDDSDWYCPNCSGKGGIDLQGVPAKKIYRDVMAYFFSARSYPIILQNVYLYEWESDIFISDVNDVAIEVEVKISRSDYLADFKKNKHKYMVGETVTQERIDIDALDEPNEGRFPVKLIEHKPENIPNQFYFACPEGLIKKDEVPKYAGLIYVGELGVTIIKRPKYIHKEKLNHEIHRRTAQILSFKYNSKILYGF